MAPQIGLADVFPVWENLSVEVKRNSPENTSPKILHDWVVSDSFWFCQAPFADRFTVFCWNLVANLVFLFRLWLCLKVREGQDDLKIPQVWTTTSGLNGLCFHCNQWAVCKTTVGWSYIIYRGISWSTVVIPVNQAVLHGMASRFQHCWLNHLALRKASNSLVPSYMSSISHDGKITYGLWRWWSVYL